MQNFGALRVNRIEIGDCRETMRRWIAEGVQVQTCITSPPYWGLRDYGVEGQIGLEPDYREFLATMVEVFGLVRQLLAKDGTLWLNIGDSYAGNRGAAWGPSASATAARGMTESRRRDNEPIPRSDVSIPGIKPKNLVMMPARLAIAMQDDGWWLRQDIIWSKPNPMPESVRDRFTKAHEYIFLMSKAERYFFDAEAVKEPCSEGAHPRRAGNGVGFGHGTDKEERGRDRVHLPGNKSHKGTAAYEAGDEHHRTKGGLVAYAEKMRAKIPSGWANGTGRSHDGIVGRYSGERKLAAAGSGTKNNESFDDAMAVMPTHRNPRSVWTIPTQPFKGSHFATFPEALVERCILAGSRPGDVVFDPFMGSGTVAQVAQRLGRRYLGCELNPKYGKLQEERLRETVGMAL